MKQPRTVPHILVIVFILFFLTASFSAVQAQEEDTDPIISKCINCCTNKKLVCFNLNPDRRLCTAEYETCVETCTSRGATSSDWSECWSSSQDDEK